MTAAKRVYLTDGELDTLYLSLCGRHDECVKSSAKARTENGKKYFDTELDKVVLLCDKIRKLKGA